MGVSSFRDHGSIVFSGPRCVQGASTRLPGRPASLSIRGFPLRWPIQPYRLTAEELRDLCARIAAAADGERRRIEGALHDGIQQDLIALSVHLQLARRLAATDPTAAPAVLDEVATQVREALDRVRALANEIYPSVLEAAGLPAALRGLASIAAIGVSVEAAGVARYPSELEAALYFFCRAVLESVAEAAQADARVAVRVEEDEHALRVTIDVGTVGFDLAGDRLGPPLDRIHVLGGDVVSEPGTSRVIVMLPL